MFVPLERAFPACKSQPILRRGFAADLAFFFGQHLLFAGLATGVLSLGAQQLSGLSALSELRRSFALVPLWAQVLGVLLLGDLVTYWGHRLQHRVDFLWRFHAVHHTAVDVDWLAAHREHPLDGLYTQAWVNLPAILLGFDLSAVMGLVAFRGVWAVFIHSNVSLPLGPLRYLIGSPALHRWHHDLDRDVGNYANLAPWLDLLFGTFYCPKHQPTALGTPEPLPRSYLGLLLAPFLPRSQARSEFAPTRE